MKIYVESYGCTLNKAETGLYANRILGEGNSLVSAPEEADLSIIGTCVVIRHTEERMISRIQELSSISRVRVIGCLPPVSGGSLDSPMIEMLKPREFREFYSGLLDNVEIREPSIFDGIPINQGCTGSCNYCISHISRGKLLSRPVDKIAGQVMMQLRRGIREVRISSLDTAAYGKDIGNRLPQLVRAITGLDEDFMLRIGMMEPKNASEILHELLASMESPKVYRFLHIPVQSGDDRILELMNREYKIEDFTAIVREFRKKFPDSTLSTDVIVGYHNEDDEAHEMTLRMLDEVRPDIVNITRFSPRPYTPDFNAPLPPSNAVKKRSRELSDLHKDIIREKLWSMVGKTIDAMVVEKGKPGTVVARDAAYRPVAVFGDFPLYTRIKVEIVDAGPTYLVGKIQS